MKVIMILWRLFVVAYFLADFLYIYVWLYLISDYSFFFR